MSLSYTPLVLEQTSDNPQIFNQLASTTFEDNAESAADITSSAFEAAKEILQLAYSERLTQRDVAEYLEAYMRAEGADNELAFPTLVMSGPELYVPHGDPLDDKQHVISPTAEKVVMIDMGCKVDGISTDITRTFFFEDTPEEVLDAYTVVLETQEAVIEAIQAGASISSLDHIVRTGLSDYISRKDVYVHRYWGHGVGRYVHEDPALWIGNEENLETGQILAIEPGLFFEDGWAVRIEDIVIVEDNGCTVLSNVSKSIEQNTILQNSSKLEFDVYLENFRYGSSSTIFVEIPQENISSIERVEYYDGYQWNIMEFVTPSLFKFIFAFNSSYSSKRILIIRIITDTNTIHHFLKFSQHPRSIAEYDLDEPIERTDSEIIPTVHTVSHEEAEMIRIRFYAFKGPDSDQMLILDSRGIVIEDLRADRGEFYWTPWASGENISVNVVGTSWRGIENCSFIIDRYQVTEIEMEDVTVSNTTTDGSPSIDSANTSSTPNLPIFTDNLVRFSVGVISALIVLSVVVVIMRKKSFY
jgi:methionine aminopeptidase